MHNIKLLIAKFFLQVFFFKLQTCFCPIVYNTGKITNTPNIQIAVIHLTESSKTLSFHVLNESDNLKPDIIHFLAIFQLKKRRIPILIRRT